MTMDQIRETAELQGLLNAISTIQSWMTKEFISEECMSEPCLGCVSCAMIELRTKLQSLANYADVEIEEIKNDKDGKRGSLE